MCVYPLHAQGSGAALTCKIHIGDKMCAWECWPRYVRSSWLWTCSHSLIRCSWTPVLGSRSPALPDGQGLTAQPLLLPYRPSCRCERSLIPDPNQIPGAIGWPSEIFRFALLCLLNFAFLVFEVFWKMLHVLVLLFHLNKKLCIPALFLKYSEDLSSWLVLLFSRRTEV
jgi:hypothetical protein